MQISQKYGLVYVVTKLGLLFVYDLETATAVYRNRISPDPIFLTASSTETGGFYAINRWAASPDAGVEGALRNTLDAWITAGKLAVQGASPTRVAVFTRWDIFQ